MTITLSKRHLIALKSVWSTDPFRKGLNGFSVYASKGGETIAFASDGKVLLCLRVESTALPEKPTFFHASFVEKVIATMRRHEDVALISQDETVHSSIHSSASESPNIFVTDKPQNPVIPDVSTVIQRAIEGDENAPSHYTTKTLKSLVKVTNTLLGHDHPVPLITRGESAGITPIGSDAMMLIMPLFEQDHVDVRWAI